MAALAVLAKNPAFQQMAMEHASEYLQTKESNDSNYDDDDDDDEPRRKRKKSKKKKRDDDDDDDDDEKDDDEDEDEEEKEERLKKKEERRLRKVNKFFMKTYNIDKDNAIKFKNAFFNIGKQGDIQEFNVRIKYGKKDAKIINIIIKNNKILKLRIILEDTKRISEIPRNSILIDGHPVGNLSIINKIVEVCIDKNET
jgi:hypothetical protein